MLGAKLKRAYSDYKQMKYSEGELIKTLQETGIKKTVAECDSKGFFEHLYKEGITSSSYEKMEQMFYEFSELGINPPEFNDAQKHKDYMKNIATVLTKMFPELGFALFVFELNKPGRSDYISNAQRETMIEAIKETLHRFENNEVYEVPGIN